MYVLVEAKTGNVISTHQTLIELVQAAFALGQANPDGSNMGEYPTIDKSDIVAYQEGNDE